MYRVMTGGRSKKPPRLGVDTVILDIEDGVALNRKEEAARPILEALCKVDFGRSECLVRINPLRDNRGVRDLEIILPAMPAGW